MFRVRRKLAGMGMTKPVKTKQQLARNHMVNQQREAESSASRCFFANKPFQPLDILQPDDAAQIQ